MNAKTQTPHDIYHFVIYHLIIWHKAPDGIEVADAEDVAKAYADFGIELAVGCWLLAVS